jgi:hypothetical protein
LRRGYWEGLGFCRRQGAQPFDRQFPMLVVGRRDGRLILILVLITKTRTPSVTLHFAATDATSAQRENVNPLLSKVRSIHLIHAMLRRETEHTSDVHAPHDSVTRAGAVGCDWLSHLKPVLGMEDKGCLVGEPVSPFCNVGVTVTLRIASKLSHLSITLEVV